MLLFAVFEVLEARDFSVRSHGAVGDGKVLDTAAIQRAIDAAAAAKGGRVVFPPGSYLSGTIRLKSHVELHLAKGANLLGSTDLSDYQRLNFLALVMANEQEKLRVKITGRELFSIMLEI